MIKPEVKLTPEQIEDCQDKFGVFLEDIEKEFGIDDEEFITQVLGLEI